MRGLAIVVLVASLATPFALAETPCEAETSGVPQTEVAPGVHVGAQAETRDCPEGRSLALAVTDPEGRSSILWYDDERGVGIEAHRPPRFVSWTDSDQGCRIFVYTFGATEVACPAGPPPSPP